MINKKLHQFNKFRNRENKKNFYSNFSIRYVLQINYYSTTMQNKYVFSEIEKKWQSQWQEKQVYNWNKHSTREDNFVIDTPPPTVSGELHVGHIFSYCQTDFIARFYRMKGKNIFYPIGFDNNGLPTERLVEKEKGIKGSNLSRKDFKKLCLDLAIEKSNKFKAIFNSIGLSTDWKLSYSTISKESTKLSQASFLDLMHKGDIYQKEQPILWDVIDQTAIAQSEVEEKEQSSYMHDIVFDLKGKNIIISTTRPELLPSCVAIFFNPKDDRYLDLKNTFARVPIFNFTVPIIPDEKVEINKGTGLVMCCTFGDMLDVFWQEKHKLPTYIMISKEGKIFFSQDLSNRIDKSSIHYLKQFSNSSIEYARKEMINLLSKNKYIASSKLVKRKLKCAERSGGALEILLSRQWFIKSKKYKKTMLALIDNLNWKPQSMKIKLQEWINNLSLDWCISRQRHFGIPIPVWYSKKNNEKGKVILPQTSDLPIDPTENTPTNYKTSEIIGEKDVMDTWATSCISMQINSGGLSKNLCQNIAKYNSIFPADLRTQGHEILRTWAFGSILKSFLHSKTLPWKNILINGWCVAKDKSKMSKSKNNVVSAKEAIEKYGSDIVRYWSSNAKTGSDIVFCNETMLEGKKFLNKVWNAAKFCLMQTSSFINTIHNPEQLIIHINCSTDKWILNLLDDTNQKVVNHFENYNFYLARFTIEEFIKKDFCDTYIELIKARSYQNSTEKKFCSNSAKACLYLVLVNIIKMLSPFFPHITEEIYSHFSLNEESIHTKDNWPKILNMDDNKEKKKNEFFMSKIIKIMHMICSLKSSRNISLKYPLKALYAYSNQLKNCPKDILEDLKNATSTKLIEILNEEEISKKKFYAIKKNLEYSFQEKEDIKIIAFL